MDTLSKKIVRILILGLLLVKGSALFAGEKIDTIWFQNGDRITGEVTELNNNKLIVSTDDGGKILIEWDQVEKVIILNTMRIVLDNGSILFGKILEGEEKGTGTIQSAGDNAFLVYLVRIVLMKQVEEGFVDRLSGLISSGFSYVKASEMLQYYLSASLDFEAEKFQIGLFYDGNYSSDPVSGSTQRQYGGANYRQYLPRKWFLVGQFTAEANSELGLDLRTGIQGGVGNSLVLTNRMHLNIGAGIQGNREQSKDLSAYNLEGILAVKNSVYISEAPDISFDISADLIPSLNDFGRIRSEINSTLRWEVFNGFYLKWSFYHSFDSKPLSSDAASSDWAITMLGLEYKL